MKIGIIQNNTKRSQKVANELEHLLKENAIEIDNNQPTHVISVGGDGTVIEAFHRYQDMVDDIKFMAIHTGHLGFYTDWREYELEDLVNSLKEHDAESISYPLLEVEVKQKNEDESERYLALNESLLKTFHETLVCDLYISDNLFERFRGDGVCISTPTGSTAYNKSVGGAVLHPRLKALQIAEIASINNNVFRTLSSSMVVAPDECITLVPSTDSSLIVTIDSKFFSVSNIEYIKYRVAKEEIHFDKYRHTDFWSRVQEAFIGDPEE